MKKGGAVFWLPFNMWFRISEQMFVYRDMISNQRCRARRRNDGRS